MKIGSHRIKLVTVDRKKRCYACKSEDHLANECTRKTNLIPTRVITPRGDLKSNEPITPKESEIEKKEDISHTELIGETENESTVVEESPPADLDFYSPTEFKESFPKLCTQDKRKISSPRRDSQAKKNTSNLSKTKSNKPDI